MLLALLSTVWVVLPKTHAASSWPLEQNGSRGENVASVQYMLQAKGYQLQADGQFGSLTAQAVMSFQGKNGLTADGIVGPLTWEKLIVTTRAGDSGPAVVALQRQLNAHGSQLTTDGKFGPLTTQAVQNFQSHHSLTADGVARPKTWLALLTNEPGSNPTPPPTSGGNARIVSTARAIENGQAVSGWSGGSVPYSWGGGHGSRPGPTLGTCVGYTGSIHPCPANHTVGVDCSGFTRWVYSIAFGSDVLGGGNTDSQISLLHRVSASNAQPGDLVFFGSSTTNTHHVGIYIGNGQMINALKTGTYVQTTSLSVFSDLVGYYHYNG